MATSLRNVFNFLSAINSQPCSLKRPIANGVYIYSPAKAMAANYFRFLQAPQNITIHGREFVISKDSMLGQYVQKITFDQVPTTGAFTLIYDITTTVDINFDALASDVELALRAITGLENITVAGDFTVGFTVTFIGIDNPLLLLSAAGSTLLDAVISIQKLSNQAWSPVLKKGDRLLHPLYGPLSINEIIEMNDIGGAILGFRVRTD